MSDTSAIEHESPIYWLHPEPDSDGVGAADEDDHEAWESLRLLGGSARGGAWTAPRVKVFNSSREPGRSFMPWFSTGTLILRDDAIYRVGGILARYGELLSLRCENAELRAFNATVATDDVDRDRSRILTWPSGSMSVRTAQFAAGVDELGIFKWSKDPRGPIYFSKALVDELTATGHTSGIEFRSTDREFLWY